MVNDTIDRRSYVQSSAALVGMGIIAGCLGDEEGDFPTQNIDMTIPYGPGGGFDTYARLVANQLENHYDQIDVTSQNVEGADGQLGVNQVYDSEPDGYTHCIVNSLTHVHHQITGSADYDLNEMDYFGQVALTNQSVGIRSDIDIETIDEFVDATSNDELTFGVIGTAGALNIIVFGEVSGLFDAENIVDNMVNFDGRGDVVTSMQRGEVDAMAGAVSSNYDYVESGDINIPFTLTWDEEPPDLVPDAETLQTAGVNNGQEVSDTVTQRRVFVGPPGIDDEVLEEIQGAYESVIASEEFQEEAEESDRPVEWAPANEAEEAIENAIDNWNEVNDLVEDFIGS